MGSRGEIFVDRENATAAWGSTEWVPALSQADIRDTVLAYQSDRNELVGLLKVAGWRSRGEHKELILKPLRRIGVKVRPPIANLPH
jgi:hypothetical protein